MAYLQWRSEYSVGNDQLDAQHKVLIELINRLQDIEEQGGQLETVFKKLDWYVAIHFRDEERLMKAANLNSLSPHIEEHREFSAWLKSVKAVYGSSGSNAHYIAGTVNQYLRSWLLNHILKSDMAYKGKL